MENQDTRNKLIEVTQKMLLNGVNVKQLTARRISSEAGTNLAMINYCFKSKDELIKIAVDNIISREFKEYYHNDDNGSAKIRLRNLLIYTSRITVKYKELTKASMPYLLLQEEIKIPLRILSLIKKHFNSTKTDKECRVIAFDIVCLLQLVFYRDDEFNRYAGIDINDEKQLTEFIDMQLDLLLPEV